MTAAARTCALTLLTLLALLTPLAPASSVAPGHSRETSDHHASAGYLFLLRCLGADDSTEVVWSRGDGGNSSLPTGVKVKDGVLWFLPVQVSHNGIYTCERRDNTGGQGINFRLLVSNKSCPDPSEVRSIINRSSGVLPCKQDDIFKLNDSNAVRWRKDCQQVEFIPANEKGAMRLLAVSQKDAGKYTCLVDISLEGQTYTGARSVQLKIDPISGPVEPQLVIPQDKVITVQVGQRAEVKCLAYIGTSEDNEISLFWTVDGVYSENFEELNLSNNFIHEGDSVYYQSILSISKVPRQFLNVPLMCHIQSPLGSEHGTAWLQEADHSDFHLSVSLCLVATVTLLALALLFVFFKVDLVLAYRKLLRYFPKQQVPDGKLYDAYVSFLRPDAMRSDETERFAFQILPEELEEHHGYSLFIRGRDDTPGEGMHDVISATVPLCHRLIIILSSHGSHPEEASPLHERGNQLSYEQRVGLHDALMQNELRVILVEMGGPVDYSCLPESLAYIRRKHGALKWRKDYHGPHKLGKPSGERHFWKNLRYRMPPVPAGRLQTVV